MSSIAHLANRQALSAKFIEQVQKQENLYQIINNCIIYTISIIVKKRLTAANFPGSFR
jgi:hypothetical protein